MIGSKIEVVKYAPTEQIKDMIDSGTQSGVRNIKLVYAPKVAWREWEQEATDGTPSEESSGEG